MAKTVALLGAMDTKGTEYAFVKRCIESRGHKTLLIDVGVLDPPAVEPDVPRSRVAEAGLIAGALDVTTTEWADELVGGVLAAGPTRLEAAARHGVPAVIAPGCLDMVNFWAPPTVPAKFQGRKFFPHNPNITLMRTTPEECRQLGEILAEKLNLSSGPVSVLLPLGGWSMIDFRQKEGRLPTSQQFRRFALGVLDADPRAG